MLGGAARSESLGFPGSRFAFHVPAAEIERNSRAGSAQFVGKSAISHGTSHDHASNGQGSYGLRCVATAAARLD
jgi:hypothetical protein